MDTMRELVDAGKQYVKSIDSAAAESALADMERILNKIIDERIAARA